MKPVLITGANGFLGKYIVDALNGTRAIYTLGTGDSNDIQVDLSKEIPNLPEVRMVVHAAGKAHMIPRTEEEKNRFFEINSKGTENLLAALDRLEKLPEIVVLISTVAVYGLDEGEGISENEPLLGDTPYALSKIEAEGLVSSWAKSRGVSALVLRLPLIIGARDSKGNLKAMIEGLKKGRYFRVGAGKSKKSMVLAKDVAELIGRLENEKGIYNLTDGIHPSIADLDSSIASVLGKKVRSIPESLLAIMAKIGDVFTILPINTYRYSKLTSTLTFSDDLARKEINWSPHNSVQGIAEEISNI